jgi:hypothetical protein
MDVVDAVHSQKVILNCGKLDRRFEWQSATHTALRSPAPSSSLRPTLEEHQDGDR